MNGQTVTESERQVITVINDSKIICTAGGIAGSCVHSSRTGRGCVLVGGSRILIICTDPLRQALARAQAARRVVGADLSAACAERENDCVLVLSCRKGCFLRTVPAGENPALWLLDIIRRTAANKPQAEGTGFLPARRAAKKDALPGPQPGRHPLRRVCMTLLVLALLAALAAVGAWEYTNGNFYALPEQLHTLLTEHVPRPGATLV